MNSPGNESTTKAPLTPINDASACVATSTQATANGAADRLPLSGLLALATACFLSLLTEIMPAGLLPQIGADLRISAAATGQLISIYALGQMLIPIPFASYTQHMRRRPLLVSSILGFAFANVVTAISTDYTLTMVFRFFAGMSSGVLWSMAAGYAMRMVPPHMAGKALAIAMAGIPLALSIGAPAGTFLGLHIGWHNAFGIVSVLCVAVVGWVFASIPDLSGLVVDRRITIGEVFAKPGVKTVMLLTVGLPLAHNVLYVYIAPYLAFRGMASSVDTVLLFYGLGAIAGLWLTGMLIDRWLHESTTITIALLLLVGLIYGLGGIYHAAIYLGVAIWGMVFGGYGTMVQTASAKAAKEGADLAQGILISVWSLTIACGGILGGVLLNVGGAVWLPWVTVILLVPTVLLAARAWRKRLFN